MKDDKGKVILSLIAGATAGIVAGLLLAPETGDETRSGLRQSVSKWGGELGKLLKDSLAKMQGEAPATSQIDPEAAVSEDKQAADRLLHNLSSTAAVLGEPGDLSTPATGNSASVAGDSEDQAHLTEQ